MATNTNKTIRINITFPLPEIEPKPVPPMPEAQKPATTPTKSPCSDCGGCGKCKTDTVHKGTPLLNHAAEALLNMAAGAYTLEQLSTALEIIEALLKRHYGRQA